MAAGATEWAWQHSRASNGALLVLLAIAREIDREGVAEMSNAEIGKAVRLAERGVRNAVRELERLGELAVTPRPGGRSGYALCMTDPGNICRGTPAISAAPAKSAGVPTPVKSAGVVDNPEKKPQVSGTPAKSAGVAISDVLDLGSVVSGKRSRSKPSSETPRDDVGRLCARLADRIEANGSKRPSIGKRWHDAARLLIDNDGRTEQQVIAAIDWCQENEFWHRNILSMPKLREKYDQLRLAALAEQRRKSQPSGRSNPDDEYAQAMQRIQSRKEHANGTRADGDNRPPRQVSLPPAAD